MCNCNGLFGGNNSCSLLILVLVFMCFCGGDMFCGGRNESCGCGCGCA